jgi:hypothetical protein
MYPFGRGLVLSVFTALTVSAVQSDENGMYLSGICKHNSLKLTCVTYEDVDRHRTESCGKQSTLKEEGRVWVMSLAYKQLPLWFKSCFLGISIEIVAVIVRSLLGYRFCVTSCSAVTIRHSHYKDRQCGMILRGETEVL